MTDELKQILCDLIERHGRELVREPKRLEGMLNDACAGQHRGARRVLVDAVQERVVEELLALRPTEQVEVVVGRARQRLIENLAIAPDAAHWAIQSWAAALQVSSVTVAVPDFGPVTITPLSEESATNEINKDFEAVRESSQTFGSSKYFMQQVTSNRLAIWRDFAERGDPKAQWLFGDWLYECNAGQSDFGAAESWWMRSANGGFVRAYSTLGWLCQNELSANFGKEHAIEWFRKGEAVQEPTAIHWLATCFLKGRGVEIDQARAVELLERSTELGYLTSAVALARCLQQGIGVKKDNARAKTLIRQAAESGNRNAQYLLGLSHLDDSTDASNRDTAIDWLDTSARRGHRGAITKLEELGLPSHRVTWTNPNGIEFCLLEPGTFQMGTKDLRGLGSREFADEMPLHPVTLCQPFWIGRYAITQEQYHSVTGMNPANFKGLWPGKWKRRPVDSVTWIEAVKFCNALSEREGLVPVYDFRGDSVIWVGGTGYRLPTEAEWEYACRAGSQSEWSWGNDADDSKDYAWCRPHYSSNGSKQIGKLRCNNNGLFDMHGNMWEWCWDYYDQTYYSRSPAVNPIGPDQGEKRVLRGGSWNELPINCRSAIRTGNLPHEEFDDIGFRIVRSESVNSIHWLPAIFRDRESHPPSCGPKQDSRSVDKSMIRLVGKECPPRRGSAVKTDRERSIQDARAIMSDDQLTAFFRAVRSECADDVFAVKTINEYLDSGDSLDDIFYTNEDDGFELTAEQQSDGSFKIEFRWLTTFMDGFAQGDGGEWTVIFDENGGVLSVTCDESWTT